MDFPRSPGCSPGTDDPPRFAIRADLSTGWIYIAGWLDHPTSHLLHDTFSALLHAQHTCWNLDVTELTGVDDAGLRALGAANSRATRHGRQLILHGATPALQQDLTRLRRAG